MVLNLFVEDSVLFGEKKEYENIETSCPCFAIVFDTGSLCPLRFVNKERFTKILKNLVSSLVNEQM